VKKELVIAQILPAMNNGGVERGCVEIANHLVNCGHRSLVISAGGRMLSQLLPEVEHITLEVGKKSLSAWFLIKKIKNLIVEKKINIIHARSRLPAWLSYLAIKKINKSKPQFITTIHGLYSVKKYSSIMACGDEVIAVSKTALNYVNKNYSRYLNSEPRLIYRGIDPKDFPFNHDPDLIWLQKFYQKNHQLVGHQIVLMPGRLTSLKGAKDLLPWLKSTDNDAKLVFTALPNSDDYSIKLLDYFKQHKVGNRILWIDVQESMADLYAVADVVVSASIRPESFGRTVLEALSIGTPVVAYNHGGVGEILDKIYPQGKVELGNQLLLAEKINTVLKQKPAITPSHPFLLQDMLNHTEQVYLESCRHG